MIFCNQNDIDKDIVSELVLEVRRANNKVNLVWLEATGCSGNIISFLNSTDPDVGEMLRDNINLCFNNSLMVSEGNGALDKINSFMGEKFILVVEGAVAAKENGKYTVIGSYQDKKITALEAVKYLAEHAQYVLAVGTCASYGGISAARPNPTGCISVVDAVGNAAKTKVVRLPGCPCHPDWFVGTLAYLIIYGKPELDSEGRPILFYGATIHDNCTRRSYFDKGIFAQKLSDPECMFKLGCTGPITKTDCPSRRWNNTMNWPIGANTPCIGCANARFPDGTEPFVKY